MSDPAEDFANTILDKYDLECSESEFECLCELLEDVALTKRGTRRSTEHIKVGRVCVRVGEAPLNQNLRTALLLTILSGHFSMVSGHAEEE